MTYSRWILIVLAIAIAGVGGAVWFKVNRSGGGQPIAPPVVKAAGQLKFQEEVRKVNLAADAQTTVVDFPFTNASDRPVLIQSVEKNCDCLEVQISDSKLRYEPGEHGVIRANFKLDNLVGEVEKSLDLYLAGDPIDKPSHRLIAQLHIAELVKFTEKTVKWTIGEPPTPQKIDIEMVHTKPIRILKTTCSLEGFQLDLKVIEDGKRYELWVTPAKTTDPGLALLRVETDCEVPRYRVLQAFALIRVPTANEEAQKTP
jgi:hypothetical protein